MNWIGVVDIDWQRFADEFGANSNDFTIVVSTYQ